MRHTSALCHTCRTIGVIRTIQEGNQVLRLYHSLQGYFCRTNGGIPILLHFRYPYIQTTCRPQIGYYSTSTVRHSSLYGNGGKQVAKNGFSACLYLSICFKIATMLHFVHIEYSNTLIINILPPPFVHMLFLHVSYFCRTFAVTKRLITERRRCLVIIALFHFEPICCSRCRRVSMANLPISGSFGTNQSSRIQA